MSDIIRDFEDVKVGRPTVLTPMVVAKLVSVLQRGVSISKACSYARIDRASFYRKYKEDEEFRNKIHDARNFATIVAAEVVVDDIVKNKSVQTAKWYLERKDPEEFGNRPQIQVNNQVNQTDYYFMSNEELTRISDELELHKISPVELFHMLWTEDSTEKKDDLSSES